MRAHLLLLTAPLALGACTAAIANPASSSTAPTAVSAVPSTAPALIPGPVSSGTFRPWTEGSTAVTYDTSAVPDGASAEVTVTSTVTGVRVHVTGTGLVPGRVYGAHLHANPCTANPSEAGPHYQHVIDPKADATHPSVDPAYANPENEVWLDFTADAKGAGHATAEQKWAFPENRPPWSLVLHAQHTHTDEGEAGTAGARLACLTRKPVPAYENLPGRG